MIANYHTHTTRCRHADGTEEEFIQAALASGLKILGFSDHTPQPFGGGYYSTMRMFPEQLPEYVQTLRALQKKYAGQLEIHVGLETEYYPAYFKTLMGWVRDVEIDYMILGQHWIGNEVGGRNVGFAFEENAKLERYCDQSIEAMQTGLFSCFAHPDLANYVGDLDFYDRNMRRLIREAKACGVPLEINLHGLSCGCDYPDVHFWEMVAEEGAPVVIGRDAHCPEEFFETETENAVLKMVDMLGLQLQETIALRKP